MFERTLELCQAEAAASNQLRPGTVPPQDQLDAHLVAIGVAYMQQLIHLVNRGHTAISRTATRSPSEVRSRIGMSEAALRARE